MIPGERESDDREFCRSKQNWSGDRIQNAG
jgi:hypothetical protein